MHAVRLHEFGPAENLVYEEVPDPRPRSGQVRIRVEAAGVHLLDTALRAGVAGGGPVAPPELPTIPGREVAGTIDAVGAGVEDSWIGRRVVAHLGPVPGGYAELAVANVGSVHELPDHLAGATAVAMIGTGRTAAGILAQAALTAEDVVLVTAAAGGLGSLFVQAARNIGATVVGLAGGEAKVEAVRALGANVAVDYDAADWPDQVTKQLGEQPITVVLDGVGGEPGRSAVGLLGIGGRVLLFGWSAGVPTAITTDDLVSRGLTATWAIGPKLFRRPGALRELESTALAHAADGRWTPLTTRFPLAKAADAHRALETRETRGKVVLLP